jgi:arylsulfatase A
VVGELMATLTRLKFAENTQVIFTSDNGPEVGTVLNMRSSHAHDGARPWRGMKRDQWEGGHRVPFVAAWPGKISEGTTSDQLISGTDIMATCASIAGADLPHDAAEDSVDILPVLMGTQGDKPVREYLLQQTIKLSMSIRHGQWKYLDHTGSGGNNYKRPHLKKWYAEDAHPAQLYNLEVDPGETNNLYEKHPEIVASLKAKLDEFTLSGRSVSVRK